jgi:hypothetical protein
MIIKEAQELNDTNKIPYAAIGRFENDADTLDTKINFASLCQKARRNLKSEQAAKLLREIENYIDQKEYERAEITVELQILGSLRARLSDKAHE